MLFQPLFTLFGECGYEMPKLSVVYWRDYNIIGLCDAWLKSQDRWYKERTRTIITDCTKISNDLYFSNHIHHNNLIINKTLSKILYDFLSCKINESNEISPLIRFHNNISVNDYTENVIFVYSPKSKIYGCLDLTGKQLMGINKNDG